MPSHQEPQLVFTADELDLLGRSADALSAYMGKPVLAEVMDAEETGFEWVIFAVPLDIQDDPSDHVVVQIGGNGAKLIGNTGGMTIADGDVFDCEYLWAIQLSDLEGVRFIKVNQEGEEIAWTENLQDILPFIMTDELAADGGLDDDEGYDPDDDQDDDLYGPDDIDPPRTLH
ncbi:hypothetical protein V0R37_01850 [Pollutimonas sp. H1-120]|uniref:hypothetical protein n=1 Tax=Pollutimonas sp. H1-120 TaxID=3148824 RepID=UPI003B524F11